MIRTYSARESAYQLLRSRILGLDLKPNESISDKELAAEMGMSRTPVREAVITLSLENLVAVRPQSGTVVAPLDPEIVGIEQFARYALEKEVIRRIVPLVTDEVNQRYRENLALYEFYLNSHDPNQIKKLLEVDNAFHRIAFELDHKERNFDILLNSQLHIERVRILSNLMGLHTTILDEHTRIADALVAGDLETAIDVLEFHLTLYYKHLEEIRKICPHYFQE